MSGDDFYYSMVVDSPADHTYKTELLLTTLEEFGGVPRERVVVQCTTRVASEVLDHFRARGHQVAVVEPYLDGMYCNKLRQLDHFVNSEVEPTRGIFLLDIDLAVLSPLDVRDPARVWGKIVDAPNPPLTVLERIFEACGVELSERVECDWGIGQTVSTNLNGGFVFVPAELARDIRDTWCRWGEFLHARRDLFDGPQQAVHVDQVAFALALASGRFPLGHLTAADNFPAHSDRRPISFEASSKVRVLHYHRCIDRFGTISIEGTEPAAVEAARRVNEMLATRAQPMRFYGAYRTAAAVAALAGVPANRGDLFGPDSAVRRPFYGGQRRLVLHGGAPKTGTSSLQLHLGSNRKALSDQGFWYPPTVHTPMPKHQELVGLLRRPDDKMFVRYIESALRDMPPKTHTVILTTEGIFNHWWDFPAEAKRQLRELSTFFEFELCIWLREPTAFARSLYLQYLKNPQQPDQVTRNVYGCDVSFAEAMGDEWFRHHLDYLGLLAEARELFGRDGVKAIHYAGDTVSTFLSYLGIEGLPFDDDRQNAALKRPGVELIRSANRFGVRAEKRQHVIDLARQLDLALGDTAEEFRLTESERRLVERFTAQNWAVVRDQFSTADIEADHR